MMSQKLLVTGLLGISTVIATGNSVQAQLYPEIIVFGDSLSDTGNLQNALIEDGQFPFPPSPPYFEGRFSNGLVWTENIVNSLKVTPNLNTFAFAGAQTGLSNLFEFAPLNVSIEVPGLLGQVNNYLNSGDTPNQDDLFLIWAGANNYLFRDLSNPQVVITETIMDINRAVFTLNSFGAKNVGVANLPDLGMLPLTREQNFAPLLSELTVAHNQFLSSSLTDLELQLGNNLNLTMIDIYSLFADTITNPSKYKLVNVENACFSNFSIVCPNADEYLFWDEFHPTAKGHRIISNFALRSIYSTPEPNTIIGLVSFALIGLGLKSRSRQKELAREKFGDYQAS